MARIKNKFPFGVRKTIYTALAQSHLVWGSIVTGATSYANLNRIGAVQNKIVRNLCNKKYNSHTTPLYFDNYFLKATDLLYYSQVLFCMKYRIDLLPKIFYKLIKYSYEFGDRSQRDSCLNFHV